jgi:HD-GYP domain-containing protein (c-di-GMP phosphodiesterase class II)
MAVFGVLLTNPAWDRPIGTPNFHFYAVSVTAVGAAVACALIIGLTRSLRETRLLCLGLAFLSIASVFAVHGLGTPGHIHDKVYPELKISSWLSVFLGAVFVALSVVSMPERVEDWLKRYGGALLSLAVLVLGTYIGLSIVANGWMSWIPVDDRKLQLIASAITLSLLGFSAWRYFQAFLFARLPTQWAMVCLMVMLMEVQVSMTWGRYWDYSWWLYHGMYALAFVVLFASWFVEARRAGSLRVIAEGLSMRDAMAQLNQGYSRPIADLVDAIEWKDLYTLGHVRRVASFALMIGKEFGLSAVELRALALGAQMHDVGKIGVPDKILTKPGALTQEEFAMIQRHVVTGFDIAKKVQALEPALAGIRYHHERFDGSGYPEGLRGDAIPLQARIIAVADAFDAMTSGRVYQPAVSYDDGIDELVRASATHFDPACVQAFARALARVGEHEVGQLPTGLTRLGSTA